VYEIRRIHSREFADRCYLRFIKWNRAISWFAYSVYTTSWYMHVQPIPLWLTFSIAVSKLKAQSSKLERLFSLQSGKRDFRAWALSFRKCHPKWDRNHHRIHKFLRSMNRKVVARVHRDSTNYLVNHAEKKLRGHSGNFLHRNREIVGKWTVGVVGEQGQWTQGPNVPSPGTKCKDFICCHIYCAHLDTPWYQIVGNSHTVSNPVPSDRPLRAEIYRGRLYLGLPVLQRKPFWRLPWNNYDCQNHIKFSLESP